MPKMQQRERKEEMERCASEALNILIAEQVIKSLGKPENFLRVQVRSLWEGYYRANVFVGTDVSSARVAHSYFLAVDGEGTITAATPNIGKQY